MVRKILIVTGEMDATADVMVRCLSDRGIPFERLHTAYFPIHLEVSSFLDGSGRMQGGVIGPSIKIAWDEVASIWFRRPDPFEFSHRLSKEERDFAFHESTAVVSGIWRCLDVLWVNHPDQVRIAESKALQLKIAAELGACVPQTLFTNDAERLREFNEALEGRIIFKSMTQGVLGRERQQSIYATRLTAENLANLGALRESPCQFQEEVPKLFDIRITIIGEQVFAVEIHAPQDSTENVDWRMHSGPNLEHAVHQLPADVQRFCLALVKRFSLNYAAIDMILTEDGRYVFLEINPNGQFGWLETMTNLRLTDALADLLASRLNQ